MTERTRPARTQAARNATASRPAPIPAAPAPAARAGMSSGGSALDKHTQATMSARFGHDFSSVRVHTDARAGQSAEAFGAHAYALGSDIVFGAGKYAPGSSDGQRLLAHELTHVAQQGQWGEKGGLSGGSRRGDAAEREADSLASQVMTGQNVQVQAAPTAAVHFYQAPDEEWSQKLSNDERVANGRGKQSIPFLGNAFSLFNGMRSLGAAGYDEITGDKDMASTRLAQAEDFGLDAIPILGNRRAAKQADHDRGVVAADKAGADPVTNVNSAQEWASGGADIFNQSVKSIWDAF